MRNISFALTTPQIRNRRKTVTRRAGWLFLKPGDLLQGVVKSQGLKKGEHPEKLCVIRVVRVSREPLNYISRAEVEHEGFPDKSPQWFIAFYCGHNKGVPSQMITRIEFEYV